jgi:hypothetical protein
MWIPRENTRKDSSSACKINLGGSKHQCRIENISISGARVNCLGFLHETWPGDKCTLLLENDDNGIESLVTHISASHIGLKFVNIPAES